MYFNVFVSPFLGDKQGSKFRGVMSIHHTHYIPGFSVVFN